MQFVAHATERRTARIARPISANHSVDIQEREFGKAVTVVPPFRAEYPLTACQRSVVEDLSAFFDHDRLEDTLYAFSSQTSTVSLRCLDWLVTNYSKKNNIVCTTMDGNLFNIYQGYKLALSNFRRRNFDPFRRKLRVQYEFRGAWHDTTIGQANFLQWARRNGVLQFALANHERIDKDMNDTNARNRRGDQRKRRRKELSEAPPSRCYVYRVDTTLQLA